MKKLLSTICSVFIIWGIIIIHYSDIESVKSGPASLEVDEKNLMLTNYGVFIFEGFPEKKGEENFKMFIPLRLVYKIVRKDEPTQLNKPLELNN